MLFHTEFILIIIAMKLTGNMTYTFDAEWLSQNTFAPASEDSRHREIEAAELFPAKRYNTVSGHKHRHSHRHSIRYKRRKTGHREPVSFSLTSSVYIKPNISPFGKKSAEKHTEKGKIKKDVQFNNQNTSIFIQTIAHPSAKYYVPRSLDKERRTQNHGQAPSEPSASQSLIPLNTLQILDQDNLFSNQTEQFARRIMSELNSKDNSDFKISSRDFSNGLQKDEPLTLHEFRGKKLQQCYDIVDILLNRTEEYMPLRFSNNPEKKSESISYQRNNTVLIQNKEECQNISRVFVGSAPTLLNVTAVTCCIRWCTHKVEIEVDSQYGMLLNFPYFNVPGLNLARSEMHEFCEESLEILMEDFTPSSSSSHGYSIGPFCGIKAPSAEVIDFSRVRLSLNLHDNRQCLDSMGFVVEIIPCLKFSSVSCNSEEYVSLSSDNGYISSPGLASGQKYPKDMDCQWKVSVSQRKLIRLKPEILHLQQGDKLEIYPLIENSREFPDVFRYSHDSFKQSIVLPGSSCVIKFQSQSLYPGKGFNISYSSEDPSNFVPMLSNASLDCSRVKEIPHFLLCDLHVDCAGGEDETLCSYRNPSCWPHGYFWGGHCYQIVLNQNNFSWNMAEQYCERNLESHLLTINTVAESLFVDKLREVFIQKLDSMFLGLQRMRIKQVRQVYRRMWQWVDGTTAFYLPNEYRYDEWEVCSILLHSSFLSIDCSSVKKNMSFICERKTESRKLNLSNIKPVPPKWKTPTDKIDAFQCKRSKEYISEDERCNGIDTCFDRSDEAGCESRILTDEKFACDSGERLAYSFVCDGVDSCLDDSDETFCKIPDKSTVGLSKAVCTDGMVIDRSLLCNAKEDCLDASDEEDCTECVSGSLLCPMIACLPQEWEEDDEVDCPHGMRVPELVFKENIFQNAPPPGIVLPDGYGKFEIKPLSFPEEPCPDTHRRCVDGYCIPVYMWCNGNKDCPHEEDEIEEICQIMCAGLYRCKHSRVCLHPDHLCDGFYQCPRHDDEMLCGFQSLICPAGCMCVRMEVTCFLRPVFKELASIHSLKITTVYLPELDLEGIAPYSLVNLNLSNCNVKIVTAKNLAFLNLRNLDLSHNAIEHLDRNTFMFCPVLKSLSLAHNQMKNISFSFLDNTRELVRLDLSYNTKPELESFCFHKAFNLEDLSLQYMDIMKISKYAFDGLLGLKRLDLKGNRIIYFTSKIFISQHNLEHLVTDNFRLCCPNVRPSKTSMNCHAPFDEISSCKDILSNIFIRSFLWIVAVLTIIGNIGVIIFRVFLDNDVKTSFRIVITCLSVSDFIMGIYLIIIGSADVAYRDRYILMEDQWKNSVYCQIAGFLCLLSSETSALFILLVTLDRLMAICFPFRKHLHFNGCSATVACIVVWLIGLTMAVVPILPPFEHWRLYSQKSIGVPLPITRIRFPGYDYAFSIFILFNIVVFFLVAVGQALIYVSIRLQEVPKEWRRHIRHDTAIAKRLTLVVLTDCLCWFPITVMGLAARAGRPVPGEMYVVATVFLLPINSAFNPFLYTLHAMMLARQARRKKRPRQKPITSSQGSS